MRGLGERLRAARAAARLRQRDVGRALAYSTATIANWETERTTPSAGDVVRLAALYSVSCDWLLTGKACLPHRFTGPPRPKPKRCPHLIPIAERCLQCETQTSPDAKPF